jgi:hypothetical protein
MRFRHLVLLYACLGFFGHGQVAKSAQACRADSLASLPQLVQERLPPRLSRTECGVFIQNFGFGNDNRTATEISNAVARDRAVFSLPFVKGVSEYLNWRAFAPANEADAIDYKKYNYAAFDAVIGAAHKLGKNVSLNLSVASFAPNYVMRDCPSFSFVHTLAAVGQRSAPVPWTGCYRKYFSAAVAALAQHYDGNPTVRYVSINGPSTLFGIETNWPMRKNSLKAPSGLESTFTLDNFVTEWKWSIDQFVAKFPQTQLAIALNDRIAIAPSHDAALAAVREIRDYAIDRYARGTMRSDKRIIIRLLGLNDGNRFQFRGPNDCSGRNASDYVLLAWERRDVAKIAFEWGSIAQRARGGAWPPDVYARTFLNGISWGAGEIDLKLPDVWDVNGGKPVATYTNAIAAAAQTYNQCGQ